MRIKRRAIFWKTLVLLKIIAHNYWEEKGWEEIKESVEVK